MASRERTLAALTVTLGTTEAAVVAGVSERDAAAARRAVGDDEATRVADQLAPPPPGIPEDAEPWAPRSTTASCADPGAP
jgi:hypothetical protein